MKNVVFVVVLVVASMLGPALRADLMSNPGFELPDTGGGSATNWWTYGGAGTYLSWAVHSGDRGAAFFTQGNSYGGIGQDVDVVLQNGDQLTFSVWGKAETGYNVADTTIQLQFFSGASLVYALTNNVYSQLTQTMDTWNQISVVVTNTANGITQVKPILAYSGCTIIEPGHTAQWDDSELTLQAIPEPVTAAFIALGFAAIYLRCRRSR